MAPPPQTAKVRERKDRNGRCGPRLARPPDSAGGNGIASASVASGRVVRRAATGGWIHTCNIFDPRPLFASARDSPPSRHRGSDSVGSWCRHLEGEARRPPGVAKSLTARL